MIGHDTLFFIHQGASRLIVDCLMLSCTTLTTTLLPATTNPPPPQVMEALKILKGGVAIGEACKYTYCLREPTRKGLFLQPTPLEKPAASCFVCNTNTVSGWHGCVGMWYRCVGVCGVCWREAAPC